MYWTQFLLRAGLPHEFAQIVGGILLVSITSHLEILTYM